MQDYLFQRFSQTLPITSMGHLQLRDGALVNNLPAYTLRPVD